MDPNTCRYRWLRKTDLLVKRGALVPQNNKPLPQESLRKHILKKLVDTLKSDEEAKSTGKSWVNIQDIWKKFCQKPRKEAVANFRLPLGHDCKAHHLNKIGIPPSSVYLFCNSRITNTKHILIFPELDKESQKGGEISKLY
ncbi:hypothetical protein TNCV_93891 [Trichonephila clavipes]|nr:hypothetical protein TNCV_93891 [Trichonephila clavipes]